MPEDVAQALAGKKSAPEGGRSMLLPVLMAAVVVAGAAGGVAARLLGSGPARAQAELVDEDAPATPSPRDVEYVYYDMPKVTTNIQERRMSRYVRAEIKLAIPTQHFKAAEADLERRKPELQSWLITFFAGCTLDDVSGEQNQRRIQRTIRDEFNERLWPRRKPLIDDVLFQEFVVQ